MFWMKNVDSSVLSPRCYGESTGCHGSDWAWLELSGDVMNSLPLPRLGDSLREREREREGERGKRRRGT